MKNSQTFLWIFLIMVANKKKKIQKKNQEVKQGRPQKFIDWKRVEDFLRAGVNQKRICGFLGFDDTTLRKHCIEKYGEEYSTFSTRLYSEGESLIEHVQFEKAMEGNPTMLQWVGKVRLGQREPENNPYDMPNELHIEQRHDNMRLEYENQKLKERLSKYEPIESVPEAQDEPKTE
jgi:hypothetical protein